LKYGETTEYLRARLTNEAPEILKAFERGKHKTIKAAARAAGIVPKKLSRFEQIVKWLPDLLTSGVVRTTKKPPHRVSGRGAITRR